MRRAALAPPPDGIVVAPDSTGRIAGVAPARASAEFSTEKRGFSTGTGKGVAKDGVLREARPRLPRDSRPVPQDDAVKTHLRCATCDLYRVTTCLQTILEAARAMRDVTGNWPAAGGHPSGLRGANCPQRAGWRTPSRPTARHAGFAFCARCESRAAAAGGLLDDGPLGPDSPRSRSQLQAKIKSSDHTPRSMGSAARPTPGKPQARRPTASC
jgi:hypothetical protein